MKPLGREDVCIRHVPPRGIPAIRAEADWLYAPLLFHTAYSNLYYYNAVPKVDEIVSTSMKIPKSLHIELKIAAAREERDMGEIIADALRAYFEKSKGRRGEK